MEEESRERTGIYSAGQVAEAGRRLGEGTGAELVILFGSYAEGKPRPDSDLDFLFIVSDEADLGEQALAAQRLFWPRMIPLDLIPMHHSHWEAERSVLARRAKREGKIVYARR